MNMDELERRLEIRMENCEDALTHHPDSVAWLARYHELGELRALVQQLKVITIPPRANSIDMTKPRALPNGGTLHGVLLYSHAKAKEWKRPILTGRQLEDICAHFQILKEQEGFVPPVSKYGEVEALRVCTLDDGHGLEADLKLYAPYAVQVVGIELHLDDRPYRTKDGGSLEPVLRGVHAQGHLQEDGLGALVQRWAMTIEALADPAQGADAQEAPGQPESPDPAQGQGDPEKGSQASTQPPAAPEIGRLAMRKRVLSLVEAGPKTYDQLRELTGQPVEALNHALFMLCKSQKIEQYQHAHYRIPDMRPVVRARKRAEKLRGQGRKTREAYTDPPDGSTARSWATSIRKEVLAYLKAHPNGATEFELTSHLCHQVGISDKLTVDHVMEQLENLTKRKVVLKGEEIHHSAGAGHLWNAASK